MQSGANGVFLSTYSSTESYFAKDLVFQVARETIK